MNTEIKARKNPDYSASAERLTNAQETREALEMLYHINREVAIALEQVKQTPLYQEYMRLVEQADNQHDSIKASIDTFGGFQDVETGQYALKQQRFSIVYLADKVPKIMPEFEKVVLRAEVDGKKVEALLKGGLITPEQMCEISVRKEIAPAYIIK